MRRCFNTTSNSWTRLGSDTDTPLIGQNLLWTPPLSPSMRLDYSNSAAHFPPPYNPPHAAYFLLSPPLRLTSQDAHKPALIRIPPTRYSQDMAVFIPPGSGRRDLRKAGLVGSRSHGAVATGAPRRGGGYRAPAEGADGRRGVPE